MGEVYQTAPERAEELGMKNAAKETWKDVSAFQTTKRAIDHGLENPESATIQDIYLANCRAGKAAALAHDEKFRAQQSASRKQPLKLVASV